jgi:hypothetical protein
MKNKLKIKNRFTGSVLFEFEKEDNTIKETLLEALKQGADLRDAYLRGADLQGANLQDAYLQDAYLRGANLQDAYLQDAYLRGANLQDADLQDANLQGAYLRGAYLQGANLQGAYLRGAYLRDADLQDAYLRGADLRGAYLQGANLLGANLQDAYLLGAEKIKCAAVFTGLYKYIVIPYITEKNIKRIIMGCHNRSLEEWESNFWNNNDEFPNNGSMKSNLRLMAYNTAKAWLELQDK